MTARGWQLRRDFPNFGGGLEIDLRDLRGLGSLESTMFKALVVVFLMALAAGSGSDASRYLFSDHGNLMSGVITLWAEYRKSCRYQAVKAFAALLAAACWFWC